MNLLHFTVVLPVALGLANAVAQTSDQRPPKAPVLRRAPAFASWTITFKYRDEEARQSAAVSSPVPQPDRVRSITVTKTDKTYQEQTTLTSGKKYEKWLLGDTQLQTAIDSASIFPVLPPSEGAPSPDYSDYRQSDFPELSWVSLENYRGVQNHDGKKAYLFESDPGARQTALLAPETQLPLASTNAEATCAYVFNPPPLAPLTPPEKFLAVLRAYKRGVEGLKYHPSLP
ncbi:MAG: hypothetical protein WC003_16525 [Terrimicrobiaceae bacterium]